MIDRNLGSILIKNGEGILFYFPPLTVERRKELIKTAKVEMIRSIRKEANCLRY